LREIEYFSLVEAIRVGNEQIVEMLIKEGVDVNRPTRSVEQKVEIDKKGAVVNSKNQKK